MNALGSVTAAQSVARADRPHAGTADRPPRPVFGEWLVLREVAPAGGRRLDLQLMQTEDVTRAVRGALLHHADDPPPATLSGHSPDGARSIGRTPPSSPSPTWAPATQAGPSSVSPSCCPGTSIPPTARPSCSLPADGSEAASASSSVAPASRNSILSSMATRPVRSTRRRGPARRAAGASVTPVALDHNPGYLFARDPVSAAQAARRAQDTVARACERIGLPRPASVQVMSRSLFAGAPAAPRFMPFPRKSRGFKRLCVHVDVRFDEPVSGPVFLGVGRYFSIGLCRLWGEQWA
jgi:CRISPR-associated protein Csb2